MPIDTLRLPPFSLVDFDTVIAQVTAINDIGESEVSSEGNGGAIPITKSVPDPPTSFVRDEDQTTKT